MKTTKKNNPICLPYAPNTLDTLEVLLIQHMEDYLPS